MAMMPVSGVVDVWLEGGMFKLSRGVWAVRGSWRSPLAYYFTKFTRLRMNYDGQDNDIGIKSPQVPVETSDGVADVVFRWSM